MQRGAAHVFRRLGQKIHRTIGAGRTGSGTRHPLGHDDGFLVFHRDIHFAGYDEIVDAVIAAKIKDEAVQAEVLVIPGDGVRFANAGIALKHARQTLQPRFAQYALVEHHGFN